MYYKLGAEDKSRPGKRGHTPRYARRRDRLTIQLQPDRLVRGNLFETDIGAGLAGGVNAKYPGGEGDGGEERDGDAVSEGGRHRVVLQLRRLM